jgi:TolB-like protein
MPIEAAAGSEDKQYLADGITEELIFELGRFNKLFVVSRTATRAIAETAYSPQTVGERLGVRYVLTGAIRQFGVQFRLSLSLSETGTGGVVWSDRVTENFENLVDQLDRLASRIASTVLGRIEESDIATARPQARVDDRLRVPFARARISSPRRGARREPARSDPLVRTRD